MNGWPWSGAPQRRTGAIELSISLSSPPTFRLESRPLTSHTHTIKPQPLSNQLLFDLSRCNQLVGLFARAFKAMGAFKCYRWVLQGNRVYEGPELVTMFKIAKSKV